MSFQKTPGGTRGARVPPSNAVTRALNRVAMSWHRRSGDKFQGQDLLYLTTVGAKTGQKRQSTVARFPDGEDAWLVVASAGGSAHHPAWYHNIAAHPDQVLDRVRRPSAAGDPRAARRRRTRASLAADHPAPATLRRVRAENRPRHPRHPPLSHRLSPEDLAIAVLWMRRPQRSWPVGRLTWVLMMWSGRRESNPHYQLGNFMALHGRHLRIG